MLRILEYRLLFAFHWYKDHNIVHSEMLSKGSIVICNPLHSGYFFMLLLSSADFFQKKKFKKVLSGTLSEWPTDQD